MLGQWVGLLMKKRGLPVTVLGTQVGGWDLAEPLEWGTDRPEMWGWEEPRGGCQVGWAIFRAPRPTLSTGGRTPFFS